MIQRSGQQPTTWGLVLLSALMGAGLMQGTASAQASDPIISQLIPNSIRAGSAGFTMLLLGANYVSGSTVLWNSSPRATNFFSAGTLEVTIPTSDLVVPGPVNLTVKNPDNKVSNIAIFTVTNPIPILTSISPVSAATGGPAFDLTVLGQGFTQDSVVRWNGSARATIYVNSGTLTARIEATDISAPGVASITVFDSAPEGGSSGSLSFVIKDVAMFFPQIAVGGGYTTVITLMNPGLEGDNGTVKFTDKDGNPMVVDASTVPPTTASTVSVSVPAGGIRIFTIRPVNATDPVKTGWARVDTSRQLLSGVSTFQTKQGTLLTSVAGVLPAELTVSATIPVDNDGTAGIGRRTGFAVANPSNADITVQIIVLDDNGVQVGNPISPPELNPLRARRQIARFLDEYAPQLTTFRGSMVLVAQGSTEEFVAVALSISQGPTSLGLMSVIPVVTGPAIR